jgi:methylated-DNA-[protein]-cysteine S-methyltransferase
MKIHHCKLKSPIGDFSLFVSDKGLKKICWDKDMEDAGWDRWFPEHEEIVWNTKHTHLTSTKEQLDAYFTKRLTAFTLPFDLEGTPFQKKVWKRLEKIPFGQTRSYQQLAIALGNEKAVRAVGNANGRNPVPVIIPCHRVIKKNGNIGGYGGGIRIKDWLLAHEGIILEK